MARLTVTFTFTFTFTVLLFTLALSVVSSEPENDNIADSQNTLSAESDPFTTNPTTLHESGPELTSSDEITVPLNFMNFHPINRHFPRRPLTFNRRPCHHHHRHSELFGRGLQIPFGNDMIFSGEEEKTTTGPDPSLDSNIVVDIPAIKMFVGPIAVEETKHHLEAEEDGSSVKITVTLMKRKEEGEGVRENMFRTKIRKFLNHLV